MILWVPHYFKSYIPELNKATGQKATRTQKQRQLTGERFSLDCCWEPSAPALPRPLYRAPCHSPRRGWGARTDRRRSRQGAALRPTPPSTSESLLCKKGCPLCTRPSETQLSVPCSGQGHVESPGVIQKSNALVLIGPHTGEDDKVLLTLNCFSMLYTI